MSSSRDTRVKSADAARSKHIITQDDVRLKDQENPFSFKQFVKRKNRSAPLERDKDNKSPVDRVKENKSSMERERNYKVGSRTYTLSPKVSVAHKKSERTVKFKEYNFSNVSIHSLKNCADQKDDGSDDTSDDDWSESYLPSFVEEALNDCRGTIPIPRNDLDAFSFSSAELIDVPVWQVNNEKDSSSTLTDVLQSTDESNSSLIDLSHGTFDSSSPLPDVPQRTCAYSPLLPDMSLESTDVSSLLEDVSSAKCECLPLSEGRCKKTEHDFVAHGDVLGDSNIQSLQRNCDELAEKNSGLQKNMEAMKKMNEDQAERIIMLERKLADKQLKEEKEAKALESMALQVEVNLKTMTMRAIRSEKNVAKLKDSIAALKAELEILKAENSKLRHIESVGLHTAKQNAQLALDSLHKVIYDAQSSVQHLVTGSETLSFVTGILKAIDKISEMPPEQQ